MLQIDIKRCTGCRMCETACSFYHTGKINRNISRIKIVNLYGIGVDCPVVCTQCKERYCMDCEVDAVSIGRLGQIIVSPTICILCKKCEKNCPIGAIELFEDIAFVCDLCGGSPKCVEVCTEGAITYTQEERKDISLEEIKKDTEMMNVSEKRTHYVKKLGNSFS